MQTNWTKDVFRTNKPIIAMCHLLALPGDPGYDKSGGICEVIRAARKDLIALQEGGVDAIMFSNEFSLPYLTHVESITVAAMARVIAELLSDIQVPFGVNVLWDPCASLDLAVVVGAKFVREIFTGVYASDFGMWNTDAGNTIRHQHRIGGEDVKLLFNIVPESAVYLAERDIAMIAKSTVFNNRPDALCVSGLVAGVQTDTSLLKKVKEAVPDTVVFANTGVCLDNVDEELLIADGAVVGTTFKFDGRFENHVDQQRVKAFMNKIKDFRRNFD
jgi:membrane complex biogenesis BtpA family protein